MPPQSALNADPYARAIEILTGTGVRQQEAQETDALWGRRLQEGGLTGRYSTNGGDYLNTLSRDQFGAALAEADRGYNLDVARFGLAQADLNYRQRATEAQDRMQQMALQVSQRGPANAIGYNYLLNNRNAPAGTEKPYGGANISQPANISVPTSVPAAAAPPTAPKPPAAPMTSYTPPEGTPNPTMAGAAGFIGANPSLTPEQRANITSGAAQAGAQSQDAASFGGRGSLNEANVGGWKDWAASYNAANAPKMARGGFLDSLGPQQAATAMVGDSPSGMPTGHEEMATATVTPEGAPRLIVAPTNGQPPDPNSPEFQRGMADAQAGTIDQAAMQNPDYQAGVAAFQQQGGGQSPPMAGGQPGGGFLDSMSAQQMPQMAAGGVVDAERVSIQPMPFTGGGGFSGGTANTSYTPQDIAGTPVVRQATGQEQTPRFGAFAGDTTIPGTDTKLPSGAEFRIDQYADMLPSSRALLESIVSTPREMGGLGLDFQDWIESSRRAAPIGRRFGPSAYGT